MTIGEVINLYNKKYTPYVGGLVNHLPMGQLAIYKMTKDLKKVKSFTKSFLERANINEVQDNYTVINTIEETLGDRSLYEPCLDLVKKELNEMGMDEYINYILNNYIYGLSSGLFHTSIRMASAIEGVRLDQSLVEEVERAIAYYITAYRESKSFTRRIPSSAIKTEMHKLSRDNSIKEILKNNDSLGKKIRALYSENEFMKIGFIIDGNEDEKIRALLDLLIPAYYFSGNIVALHCITGLHAVIVMKDYFDDYLKALDILTTSIITHLLSIGYHDWSDKLVKLSHMSWDAIISVACDRTDTHAVKLTYTCHELYKLYRMKGLKEIAIKRIGNN